ncbi:MAG: RNase adapter RapZ [Candidatus Dormibacteraeota bacterium]|nr:RNase adapter RapZ [Candidatus Dormibacteraeota bacterium]
MSVWIVTGPSGAGKTLALAALESAGVECVDNLPANLLNDFVQTPRDGHAAVVLDARQGERLRRFDGAADAGVLFLDARDDVLLRRAGESVRPHPLASAGSLAAAVRAERELLEPLRAAADLILDTSELTPHDLQHQVREVVFGEGATAASLRCTISSFGHKFGASTDADWVLDARLVRNPFWVDDLRPLTGLDARVRDYVLADPASQDLLDRAVSLLGWVALQYAHRGRRFMHVAIGCTGGRHRSVALAVALAGRLHAEGLDVTVRHRDVDKPDPRSA